MFKDRYKIAKQAAKKGGNTEWSADRKRRGRPIEPPPEEKSTEQQRYENKMRRRADAIAKQDKAKAAKIKKDKRAALKKAKAAAKKAGRKWTSKDAKPYK